MMPLLQESTPKREILSSRDSIMKVESEETTTLKNPLSSVGYPFPNPAMFTSSQLLMASQLMAASGLTIPTNPAAFFHPGLLPLAWTANSPPSPPTSNNGQLSPAQLKSAVRKNNNNSSTTNNNNNNIVTSSSADSISRLAKRKPAAWKTTTTDSEVVIIPPLSSPTSSSSPPSSSDVKDSSRDRPFTCDVCNRSFGYKHVLQNHERTHTGEKPFECQECHKRFTRDHHLKTHMRLHTGERPYHCVHCDRQFVQVANLRRHLRVHTGERPYTCEHCSAKFSDSNQLKAHLLIHTNEKPYECERCHSRFRRRHHLNHHKCGVANSVVEIEPEESDVEDEVNKRRRIRHHQHVPSVMPLVTLPLTVALPEQTEPEDLSMTTGLHSHSSGGDSPLSRSPSSREDLMEDEDYESAAIFLQRRMPLTHS